MRPLPRRVVSSSIPGAVLLANLACLGCPACAERTGAASAGVGADGDATAPNPWNLDVSALPSSPSSEAVVSWLESQGGWGTGTLRIDFSLTLLEADASAPFRSFTPTSDFYVPDCDDVPFPVPPGGALEGENGYACTGGGDCHLLVLHRASGKLYEMWRADLSDGVFRGGCAAVWDLGRSYDDHLRGEDCTSADAGGFPIAAMIFSADEVAAGAIEHAVRFILPNDRIQSGVYTHPATHSTGAASGGPDAPPFGARLRLRATYPVSDLAPGAQVVARAMQKYGMILADGGNIALTAQNDAFGAHTWGEVGIDALSLAALSVTDMELVDLGPLVPYTGDCVREP